MEAAVYFCCVESLQNVDKHAGLGATAVVRLWERDGRLSFEVVDNGVGYDVADRHAGQGQTNMSDRIAALGGTSDRVDAGKGVPPSGRTSRVADAAGRES